ncbi:MAG: hypothetical protein A2287_09790 [Candidatus Melainabacteria bacterium RIFOXYA12_FULL_32_12]|nr:MAG: hypothetical protein A2255_09895 [Candidatus Melainabacteria bacterium RIFOXYA2_FULL_32_9]OGI30234.1 MAG: hypothetical protein A2287_09790 [Candidatus Melainabacteria bacterium RIFOXYA12_FULL_32_12]
MKIFKKESSIILLLLLVCSFFFFFKLGSYKLIDVDEPRYAEAAREMLANSNWITPYFNYELRFDKPIFFYWLVMISFLFFGISEFAARFPSALLATALVLFTYYFGRTTVSRSFGLISSLILATSLEFIAMARMSITDMTLIFFVSATIYSAILATFSKSSFKKCWWWLAYLFCGIAVLTKGPLGIILTGIVLIPYLILTGKLKESLNPKFTIPGFIIFALAVIPWYYAIIAEHGRAFTDYFFIKHNISRFSGDFIQHQQPFYFYFAVIFIGFFPWAIYFIPIAIKEILNLCKHIVNSKVEFKKLNFALLKEADNKSKIITLSIMWFISMLALFSVSKAKLITYILPLFPAMSLLTGNMWNDFIQNNKNTKMINLSAKVFTAVCFIMGLIATFGLNLLLPRDEKLHVAHFNPIFIIIFMVIPIFMLFYLKKNHKIKAFITTIILMSVITSVAINNIVHIVYNSGQKDLINYITLSKSLPLFNNKLVTYNLTKPSIVFYSRHKIIDIPSIDKLTEILNNQNPILIAARNKDLNEIQANTKFYLVRKGARYSLISNINITSP